MEKNFRPVDIEKELLGSLLLKDGLVIPQVAAILKPDDFSYSLYRDIYQIILDLYNGGTIPTLLSITNAAQKHPMFKDNEQLFKKEIVELGDVAFTTACAEEYANIIKEKSLRRQVMRFAEKFYRDLADPQKETVALLSTAENVLRTFGNNVAPTKLITPQFFFDEVLDGEIEKNQRYATRQTGFSNIDDNQIFSPGLYVLGATPACGKTTFAWQLLEQLAQNDETCIFCSYEMSAFELYTKTLSRQLFLRDAQATLSAADIRRGGSSPELQKLKQEIKNFKGVNVFELRDETVDDLLRIIRPHCTNTRKAPVVCVDYLQIIPPSADKKLTTDKMKIDDIVRKLKTFQRETGTTFIIISSFNRQNYYSQISFESFKESGNIEYTADVIWAIQLNVVNEIKGGADVSQIRKKFEDAKRQQPRDVQFRCLKNRQGNNYDLNFNYFSKHDYFQPSAAEVELPPDTENIETVDFENV